MPHIHQAFHDGKHFQARHSLPHWAGELACAVLRAVGSAPGIANFADIVASDELPGDWAKPQRRDRLARLLATPLEVDGRWLVTTQSRPAVRRYEKTRTVSVQAGSLGADAPPTAAPQVPAVAPPLTVATSHGSALPPAASGDAERWAAIERRVSALEQRLLAAPTLAPQSISAPVAPAPLAPEPPKPSPAETPRGAWDTPEKRMTKLFLYKGFEDDGRDYTVGRAEAVVASTGQPEREWSYGLIPKLLQRIPELKDGASVAAARERLRAAVPERHRKHFQRTDEYPIAFDPVDADRWFEPKPRPVDVERWPEWCERAVAVLRLTCATTDALGAEPLLLADEVFVPPVEPQLGWPDVVMRHVFGRIRAIRRTIRRGPQNPSFWTPDPDKIVVPCWEHLEIQVGGAERTMAELAPYIESWQLEQLEGAEP